MVNDRVEDTRPSVPQTNQDPCDVIHGNSTSGIQSQMPSATSPMRQNHSLVPVMQYAYQADHDSLFLPSSSTEAPQVTRALEEDGTEAPTVCFSASYRHHPYHHHLMCNHDIVTKDIQPCGANCSTSVTAESKARGRQHVCPHEECSKWRERKAKVFVNKRRTRPGAKSEIICLLSDVSGQDRQADEARSKETFGKLIGAFSKLEIARKDAGVGRRTALTAFRQRSRSPTKEPDTDQGYRERSPSRAVSRRHYTPSAIDENDPAIVQLKRVARGPGVATRSKRLHLPTHEQLRQELEIDGASRELKGLVVDGTAKLACGFFTTKGFVGTLMSNDDSKQQPNSHVRFRGEQKNRLRNVHAGEFSLTDEQQARMKAEEEHVEMENEHEELRELRMPRNQVNAEFDAQEEHCICHSQAEGSLVECTQCKRHFHPHCVGKGTASDSDYLDSNNLDILRRQDAEHYKSMINNDIAFAFFCSECEEKNRLASSVLSNKFTLRDERSQRAQTRQKRKAQEACEQVAWRIKMKKRQRDIELWGQEEDDDVVDEQAWDMMDTT